VSFFELATDQVTAAKRNKRGPRAVDRDVWRLNHVARGPRWSSNLPHALVEWVAMPIVTREGDRCCKLRPSRCANTPRWRRSPPGSGSASPPPTPAPARAPGLLKTLREHEPGFILLDGTLAECDRVGDDRADYSRRHLRQGVPSWLISPTRAPAHGWPPASNAGPSRGSPPPTRPATGPWPQHGHPSNAASHSW